MLWVNSMRKNNYNNSNNNLNGEIKTYKLSKDEIDKRYGHITLNKRDERIKNRNNILIKENTDLDIIEKRIYQTLKNLSDNNIVVGYTQKEIVQKAGYDLNTNGIGGRFIKSFILLENKKLIKKHRGRINEYVILKNLDIGISNITNVVRKIDYTVIEFYNKLKTFADENNIINISSDILAKNMGYLDSFSSNYLYNLNHLIHENRIQRIKVDKNFYYKINEINIKNDELNDELKLNKQLYELLNVYCEKSSNKDIKNHISNLKQLLTDEINKLSIQIKNIDINDIVIKDKFLKTQPSIDKIQEKLAYYKEHNKFNKDIVVDKDNVLKDGYINYLIYKMLNINIIKVVVQ